MQAISRPMTADEQRQLKGAISSDGFGPWFINVGFGAALLVLPLVLVTALLHQKRLQQDLLPFAIGLGAAIGLYFHLKGRSRLASAHASLRQDLRDGVVEEVQATVLDAVCIPEFEDEGPALFLAVSPATTLFLQGQYLYETGEAGERLRSQIRIARAPTSRTVLDFSATGDVVRPVTRLPGGIYDQLPEDGEVLPVSLREAAERHGKRRNAEERRRRTRGSTPSRRA